MRTALIVLVLVINNFMSEVFASEDFEFTLRQDGKDKNLLDKPANVTYVDPDEGRSSYNVNAALKGTYAPTGTNWEYGLTLEAHKNTLINKEQDIVIFDINSEGSWGNLESGYRIRPDFSIGLKSDQESDAESVQAIAELAFFYGKLGINKALGGDNFRWYWAPTFALEYEDISGEGDNPDGDVGRFYSDIDLVFYPFFKKTDGGRLSVQLSYSNWQDFSEDSRIDDGDDSHELASLSINWQLRKSPEKGEPHHFIPSIGIVWLDGEDPRNNLPEQDFTQITFGLLY